MAYQRTPVRYPLCRSVREKEKEKEEEEEEGLCEDITAGKKEEKEKKKKGEDNDSRRSEQLARSWEPYPMVRAKGGEGLDAGGRKNHVIWPQLAEGMRTILEVWGGAGRVEVR